jgi:hypothetical protein
MQAESVRQKRRKIEWLNKRERKIGDTSGNKS